MAAAYLGDGSYGGGATSVIHGDSAHPDHIVIADAQFLFTAHFHRAGPDLVLTGADGHKLLIPGYFASEHPAALVAPSGASLSAHLVELLAGSVAPNEYAQAGAAAPPEPIGRVEKVVGEVTVIRNGVAVTLNVGDSVYKSDVVQTGANSSAGVAFPDGSALNLVANTRMALNEYSYDPNSTSNSALFSLVEGGLSFVAGKVAHTGDMQIGTPIATMGIRGTAGWLYEDQVATVTAQAGNVTLHFAAVFDGVTNSQSAYSLYAIDANGNLQHDANGNLIELAQVSSLQNNLVTTLTGNGFNALPGVTVAPPDVTQQQFFNFVAPQVINIAIQAIQQYQQQQTNPQSNPGGTGSSTPPGTPSHGDSNPQIEHINLNDGGLPVTITTVIQNTPTTTPPLVQAPQPTTTPAATGPQTFTWSPPAGSSPQPFTNPPDWNGGPTPSPTSIPGPTDNVLDNSSTPMLVNGPETIADLTVGTGALVHVVGSSAPGSLTVTGTTSDSGTITSDSTTDDPTITFGQGVTLGPGGVIEAIAAGNAAGIIFASGVTMGAGAKVLASGNGASVTFDGGATIAAGAEIDAQGAGASVFITNVSGPVVTNSGLLLAEDGGHVTLFDVQIENADGTIEATNSLASGSLVSLISFSGSDIIGGTLETGDPVWSFGGEIEIGAGLEATFFDGSTAAGPVTVDAFVQVDDGASLDLVGAITNDGEISLADGATLILSGAVADGGSIFDGGNIEVTASSTLDNSTVDGDVGALTVDSGVTLTLDDTTLENLVVTNNGMLQLDSGHTLHLNNATIEGGTIVDNNDIEISGSVTIGGAAVHGAGTITVDSGAILTLDGDTLENVDIINHGTVWANDAEVTNLVNVTINGGELAAANSGSFDVQNGPDNAGSTIENATIVDTNIQVEGTLTLNGDNISGGVLDAALGSAVEQPVEIGVPGYDAIGPVVSANDQFVAFIASTSLPGEGSGDTNGLIEIYNVATGTLTNLSALVPQADLNEGEVFGNVPSISDNGHLVVFDGKYSTDNGPTSDVFLYNSQAAPGAQITLLRQDTGQAAISGNGQFIAAEGNTTGNGGTHILVMNDSGAVQTEIEGDPNYTPPNNNSDNFGNAGSVYDPALSDDGRFVTFWSTSSEIAIVGGSTFTTGNNTGAAEIYVYDRLTNTLQEASHTVGGGPANGDSGTLTLGSEDNSWAPSISGNGRFVVFQSTSSDLVNGIGDANNDVSNIFLYDRVTGTVSALTYSDGSSFTGNSIRPTISADGKYITFSSDASFLPGADGGWQTYIIERDPTSGISLAGPQLLSTGFAGLDNGQNNLASGVGDGGGTTAFGGAVFGINADQSQQKLVSPGTVTFAGVSVSDFNGASDTLTVTIGVQHGTLTPTAQLAGLTIVDGNDGSHGVLEFTGSLAAVNAALESGVTYASTAAGDDTFSLNVTNGAAESATLTSEFNPYAPDSSQLFVSGGFSNTGQYDIFLDNQQTINVTGNTTIYSAEIDGGLVTIASGVVLTLSLITDNLTSFHDFGATIDFTESSGLLGTGIFGGQNQNGTPNGQVIIGSGVTLILDGAVFKNVAVTANSDGHTPTFQVDAGFTFTWAGNSTFSGPGSVIIDNNGHIIHAGTLDVGFSQVTFLGTGTDTFNGGNSGTEAETLTNEGNTLDGYGTFGSGVTIENDAGRFDADVAGQALVLDTGHQITNDGTFVADGGILKVLDTVTGSGSAIIEHGGTLELGNFDSQAVTFDDASTLQLDQQQKGNAEAYTGTIDGMAPGDVVDLRGFGASSTDCFEVKASYNIDSNVTTLTVVDVTQGETSAPIKVSGDFANPSDWSVASDGQGGIDVTAVQAPTADDWTGNAGDGHWSNAGNWDNGVPTTKSEVNIAVSGAIVTFDVSASPDTIDTLSTNGGTTLDIKAGALTISGADGNSGVEGTLDVGGTLDIQNSALALSGPVTVSGLLEATDHGTLDIQTGAIDNSGTDGSGIAIDGTSDFVLDSSGFVQIGNNFLSNVVELTGGGDVSMARGSQIGDNADNNAIVASGAVLYNLDNDVFGAGTIGGADGHLRLYNAADGTIDADSSGQTLTLDTDNTIHNAGLLEATSGGILQIEDQVNNSGTVLANGGTVVFSDGASLSGAGQVEITGGGILDFAGNTSQSVTFAGAGTLEAASYHGTISGFGAGDVYDFLSDVPYTTGQTVVWTQTSDAGGTLQVFKDGGDTLEATLNLAGTYTTADFALAPDSSNENAGTEVVFNSPDYWASVDFPIQPNPGTHLFGGDVQVDGVANVVAVLYATTNDYNPDGDPQGPYSFTRDVLPLDPFLLSTLDGSQVAVATAQTTLPARAKVIVPNVLDGDNVTPEGIAFYVAQKGGVQVIDGLTAQPNGGDAPLTITLSPDNPIESGASTADTIYNLDLSFRDDASTSTTPAIPYLTTYAIAWDQYTSGNYTINFQIFNADGSSSSPLESLSDLPSFNGVTVSDQAGTNGATNLPAWEFRSGGSIYALAMAQYNSTSGRDFLQFTGYATNGTQNTSNSQELESFQVTANLSHYADGAVNQITQDVIPSLSPFPAASQQLEFAQVSSTNANDWAIGWNETVLSATGAFLGDQVEFVVVEPHVSTALIHYTDQLSDAQNVRVLTYSGPSGDDFVVFAYGDNTTTHLVEFEINNGGATATEVASVVDPTTQVFSDVTSLGDGRFAVEYNDTVGPSQTSQFNYQIFDLRTSGLSINDSSLSDGQDKYFAGTHFTDTVTAENNVNNLYYFVGLATTSGSGPADTFHGGSGAWNIAVFADARSDYSISTQIENNGPNITTIASNGDDPAHTGSLAVTNVEFLAFDPANDPTPHNNIIDVNGGTFVILGGNSAVTIENGATAEFDSAASGQATYGGNVTFEGGVGVLQVDQLNELTGQISGMAHDNPNQVLELDGFGGHDSDAFSVTTALDGNGNTVLTVADLNLDGQPSESVTLTGDYAGDAWTAADDGKGGVNVFDPPASSATGNASTGFLPSDEQITFGPNGQVTYTIDSSTTAGMTTTQNETTTIANGGAVVGGPGNDNFVFQPGMGSATVANFNAQQDTLSFDHFTQVQTAQELQSLITTDAHGDAIVNLGHNDIVTLTGVTTAQLQQAIQAGHVLLH